MLSENLEKALNEQINYEFYSAHLYLSVAAYFSNIDLDGFANFFLVQAEEEKFHAMKFYNYVNEMEGRVLLKGFQNPPIYFESPLDAFEKSLQHEKIVTKRIYDLSDIAMEEREHATLSLLRWFIDEQVEEEKNINNIIKKLKRVENDMAALYMIDNELAARVFVPPVNA